MLISWAEYLKGVEFGYPGTSHSVCERLAFTEVRRRRYLASQLWLIVVCYSIDKIPSAFIITGPDIASQDLLFDQLADNLEANTTGKVVRLRSAEAGSLKAALKRIIQGVTTRQATGDEDEDEEEGVAAEKGISGRRYLDYDLEALHAFLKTQSYDHVYVSFQDSEGFDSGLLSELITLLR